MPPTPFSRAIDPSALNVTFEMIVFGLLKCGVFVRLNTSARTCSVLVCAEAEHAEQAHVDVRSGRARDTRQWPALPNRACVTGLKALTSKY